MERTPEHEQLIDDLAEKAGIDRAVAAQISDAFLEQLTKMLLDKAVDHFLRGKWPKGAAGGVVSGRPPQVLTNEFVVPKQVTKSDSAVA